MSIPQEAPKHSGTIARSGYFKGRWIAKCKCGWCCIGPLRPLRKMVTEHKAIDKPKEAA